MVTSQTFMRQALNSPRLSTTNCWVQSHVPRRRENYRVSMLVDDLLDHGTAVPLYFLLRNGWHGRVVPLGYSFLIEPRSSALRSVHRESCRCNWADVSRSSPAAT